ncbi:MAG: sulfotransferase domain-containing protein [Bacteroidota bacterium]
MKLFLPYLKQDWKNKEFKKVIIAGIPRGGTTWLAELFSAVPNSAYIHEPLNLGRIRQVQYLKFHSRQYIPSDAKWEEAKNFMHDLVNGKIINPALLIHNQDIPALLRSEYLVLKFCRLNQMLPWFTKNVETLKPIYIIRHPCAVVYSQMNHGAFKYNIDFPYVFKAPGGPFNNDLYKTIEKEIYPLKSIEEVLALHWCLDSMPLYQMENNSSWTTVAYEEGILNQDTFIDKLFSSNKIEIPSDIERRLAKPSYSTQKNNRLRDGSSQLKKWKDKLTKTSINKIFDVLKFFGHDVYSSDLEPDYSKLIKHNSNIFFTP